MFLLTMFVHYVVFATESDQMCQSMQAIALKNIDAWSFTACSAAAFARHPPSDLGAMGCSGVSPTRDLLEQLFVRRRLLHPQAEQ